MKIGFQREMRRSEALLALLLKALSIFFLWPIRLIPNRSRSHSLIRGKSANLKSFGRGRREEDEGGMSKVSRGKEEKKEEVGLITSTWRRLFLYWERPIPSKSSVIHLCHLPTTNQPTKRTNKARG